MIWDAIAKYGNDHPVIMRGIVGTVSFALFGYIALAAITSSIIDGNRSSCERGNAIRLADLREASALETAVTNEKGQADSQEQEALREKIEAYRAKQESLIAVAEESGNQNTRGAVTINCTNEWPKPLPWLGG